MKGMFKIALLLLFSLLITTGYVNTASALSIGVAWVGQAGMPGRVTAGFEEAIKVLAPDIEIEYKKELASMDELGQVVAKWQKEKDGMVILRSNGAKWLGQNPPAIPTFIGGCNHPGQLGAVKKLEAPEGNITGVTYFLTVKSQFEVFQVILPELKSVLLILEKGHPSSEIDRQGTKKVCADSGIEYHEVELSTTEEVVAAVKEAQGKVSVIIIGNQSLGIDNTADIVAAAGDTVVLAYSSAPVKNGALAGFVADDRKLGGMLAESLVDVLKNGKAIKDVPIKFDPKPIFFLNAKAAEKFELEIPYSILESASIIE